MNHPNKSPIFLLIQDNVVVDRSFFVRTIHFEAIAEYAGFKVAVGYIGDGSKRRIVGVLADVAPLIGQEYWHISSEDYAGVIDGGDYSPTGFVRCALRDLSTGGRLSDLNNLPQTLTITAGRTARDRELSNLTAIKR